MNNKTTLKKDRSALRFLCSLLIFTAIFAAFTGGVSLTNFYAKATELAEPESGVNGSGSYQLNSTAGDSRFYSEYFINCNNNPYFSEKVYGYQTAGIDRQNHIQVYLKKGETAYFGSSVYASCITVDDEPNITNIPDSTAVVQGAKTFYTTGADIVLIKPDKTKVPFDVTRNGAGYIASTEQEKNGPIINSADAAANTNTGDNYSQNARYTPLSYTAEEDGVYTLLFHSTTGWNNGTNPTIVGVANNSNWDNAQIGKSAQGYNYVSAWDITVVGANEDNTALEVKPGRSWANYLALNSGTADYRYKSSLHVNVLTADGYIYKVDFEEFVPWGFMFFANNAGFTTTDDYPLSIYHSFYDNDNSLDNMNKATEENVTIHLPYAEDTETQKTFKVFFNTPSDELPETIKPALQVPNKISNLRLTNGSDIGVSHHGQGGYFTFDADGASSVSIELNLRECLEKLIAENPDNEELQNYKEHGSGIIQLSGPVTHGKNAFNWDGTDTHGVVIPMGLYKNSEFKIYTEEKTGEIHFPLIDAEGLYGGMTVERINGEDSASGHSRYDLYYNNNPLVYGTIEGAGETPDKTGSYFNLSDNTRSYDATIGNVGGVEYFKVNSSGKPAYSGRVNMLDSERISTLKKDDKDYISQLTYGKPYSALTPEEMEFIDTSFADFTDSYHHEPVDSSSVSMQFSNGSNSGGGNQAGIDLWTYYSTGNREYTATADFAIIESENTGVITGEIFYDENLDATYQKNVGGNGDQPLKDVMVTLVDASGNQIMHTVTLPVFNENGMFVYDDDGNVLYETRESPFVATTDANGIYTFMGVPYPQVGSTTYYLKVLLSDIQTDVLKYLPTTSKKAVDAGYLANGTGTVIPTTSGPDGTKYTIRQDTIGGDIVFSADYVRDSDGNIVFDTTSVMKQSVSLSSSVQKAKFKNVGYSIGVPLEYQRNYEVVKKWANGTEPLDSITVELYYWNPEVANGGGNGQGLNRRTGTLVDKVKLDSKNDWKYVWPQLDSRHQYYFIEYYTKKRADGSAYYTDTGEERLVLVGGTMPIYASRPPSDELYYDLDVNEGETYNGHIITEEPKHYFGDNITHPDATTEFEKQTTIDGDAMLYDVNYNLTVADTTYITTLTNAQDYDEREYYVWLDHERELPNFISKTVFNPDGTKASIPVSLVECTEDHEGHRSEQHIKGLTVTSLDASYSENEEGNASDTFRFDPFNNTSVYFTANDNIYKTGTGSRTYKCEYTVDSEGNPVAVYVDNGVPVPADPSITEYTTYSWTLTIHVYDVEPDKTFYYDPFEPSVTLQKALSTSAKLDWQWSGVDYINNDTRTRISDDGALSGTGAIFDNDVYRVPRYKGAVDDLMDSCADIVGIAYSPNGIYADDKDAEQLTYWDDKSGSIGTVITPLAYDSYGNPYGKEGSGKAEAYGKGGTLNVNLATPRTTNTAKGQDHLNYADITFTPNETFNGYEGDVFYYKTVVYSEDYSLKNTPYDELDATQGVVMYTYIKLIPEHVTGQLNITKKLRGNMYDLNEYFKMTVTFTVPEYRTVHTPITYNGGYKYTLGAYTDIENGTIDAEWTGTKTVNFYLRNNDTITFQNLEAGISYTINELSYASYGYDPPAFEFDNNTEPGDTVLTGSLWDQNYANGVITDESDTVTVTNTKDVNIDVGTTIEDYMLAIAIAVIVFFAMYIFFIISKRRRNI